MVERGSEIGEVRLADLFTFLSIVRSGSISGAARGLEVTPSQVSKAVARLEHQLNLKLLIRGARGISVSETGKRIMPQFEDLLARARALHSFSDPPEPELTVVGSAYLNQLFLPRIVESLPQFRVRNLELPPGVAAAYASEHRFDLAISTGSERWPDSWVRTRIGALRKALFGSPAVARRLGSAPIPVEKLREVTFIAPIYGYYGQVVLGDDGCPIPYGNRRIGHQTQTLTVALEVAERTDQLVFAPAIAARALIRRGALSEIAVEGWDVSDSLYLLCDGERVRARVQKEIVEALRGMLTE